MRYLILISLLLLSVNVHAEVHKWVDSAGNVHYSDIAPSANTNVQQLQVPKAAAAETASGVSAGKSIFEREADLEKARKAREKAEQKATKKQKQAAAKRQNCENARNALNSLENSPRLFTYDANGNRSFMDDATRRQRTEQARKAVSESCN